MTTRERKQNRPTQPEGEYSSFAELDGRHPWQEQVPEGMILYPTRRLPGGKVSYFNFELAREMGLIPATHPNRLNKKLIDAILNTFCLRIVNEYDQQHKVHVSPNTLKKYPYMATRYLQLQHADRTGKTSGDGRCIWNGLFESPDGSVWDVSSRGTGVTALAPGAVEAGVPLKSGNSDHGYGCGMAEIDELFGAAISAEIFYRNGIPTERVLAVIDLGKGIGIGVRAGQNLMRPAHLFSFLRQNKIEPLRRGVDYLIGRQFANKKWDIRPIDKNRYSKMLETVVESYAKFVAYLDRDYIFAWLDWDGDNVLADAGIIDYGSVRQFGLRHDQYRYDDVERFSTNLNEQKTKAREIIQTFAQLVNYLESGTKRPWRNFDKSKALRSFEEQFQKHSLDRFLYQVGYPEPLRKVILNRHRKEAEELFAAHSRIERIKTSCKLKKVADGVHRPAIFNMRAALSLMPRHLLEQGDKTTLLSAREFFTCILSGQAGSKDQHLHADLPEKFLRWQNCYLKLAQKITTPTTWSKTLEVVKARSERVNCDARMTGNALINIVDKLLRHRRRGLTDVEVQEAIDQLISAQTLNPDFTPKAPQKAKIPQAKTESIMRSFLSVVHGFREDI